jgi:hypothetical protein
MGDAFVKRMPHHQGIRALWETKWKFPVSICLGERFVAAGTKRGRDTNADSKVRSVRIVFIRFTMESLRISSQCLTT